MSDTTNTTSDDSSNDNNSNNNNNNNDGSTSTIVASNDSEIIRSSLRLYGSLYVGIFFLFCFLRIKLPKLYNLRSWVDGYKYHLATTMSDKYGFISWSWMVFQVSDDDILRYCGMDAVAFLRCLRLGAKLAAVGMFNAIWLIPTFYTASETPAQDKFVRMTAGNLPPASPRFLAVVVATYIVVLTSLYLLTKEYTWYTEMRHKFLSLDMPRNYAIYVAGIPEEYRSDYALADFFKMASTISSNNHENNNDDTTNNDEEHQFVEANIAMDIPKLESKVAKRERIVEKLEHAIAEEQIKGIVKTHRTFNIQNATTKEKRVTENVQSVQTYRQTLEELNREISLEIGRLRNSNNRFRRHLHKSSASNNLLRGRALTLDNDNEGITTNERPPSIDDGLSSSSNNERDDSFFSCKMRMDLSVNESQVDEEEDDTTQDDNTSETFAEGEKVVQVGFAEDHDIETPRLVNSVDGESSNDDDNEFPPSSRSSIEMTENGRSSNVTGTLDLAESSERIKPARFSMKQSFSGSNPLKSISKRASSTIQQAGNVRVDTITGGVKKARDMSVYGSKKVRDLGISSAQKAADGAKSTAVMGMKQAQTSFVENAAAFVPILNSRGEGTPREAGFVVFDGLYLTQAALQMLQHPDGTKMVVEEATDPETIFWRNVGLPSSSRRTGSVISIASTATLCLFWSIPVAFISSLTEVNSLKETLPRLGELIEQSPALERIFAVLAPLLLLALNEGVLPIILRYFCTWEGHISSPRLEASLFRKLAAFAIIQTFFVSTVSGSISSELANMLNDTGEIVEFLGSSLPAQSSYFIQIVFVFTFFVQGLELLRVVPLSYALVRRFVGPRLTKAERKKKWKFIYSLEDPPPFLLADVFAQIVLFYVVFFVYSSTSPMTCVFLGGCFVIMESGYRYHIIHNFKPGSDSGGRLWKGFMNLLLSSMIIGQLTLIGLLLLNQAFYSIPALAPLLAITVIYWATVHPRRIHVANFLPAIRAKELDYMHVPSADDRSMCFDEIKDIYMQPALQQPIITVESSGEDEWCHSGDQSIDC